MASLVRQQCVHFEDPKTGKRVPKGTPGAVRVKAKSPIWYGEEVEV